MWSLAWPWMLLALPLPFIVRALMPPVVGTQDAGLRVPSFRGFEMLADRSEVEQLLNWRFWIAVVAWVLLVLAAARPERIGDELDVPVSGRNLMLAVDLSGSMDAKDFELGNRRVDRLTATKAVAGDFIGRREGDRIGLILFGERAYLQAPLTFDRRTVRVWLDEARVGIAGSKTAIGDAIGLAVKRLRERPTNSRVLVLITDGANNGGELDPLLAATLAAEESVRIHTIGIGAVPEEGGVLSRFGFNPGLDLDEPTLRAIAEQTGGEYFRAASSAELKAIGAALDRLEPAAQQPTQARLAEALYIWPLSAALLISLLMVAASLWSAQLQRLAWRREQRR